MAQAPITDAQALEALQLVREHGGVEQAAAASEIPASTLRRRAAAAEKRGLIKERLSPEAKLRIENAALRRDLRTLEREHDSAEKIRTEIFNLAARTPEPPAWLTPARSPLGHRGTPVLLCSDWHYGEVVRPEEVGGTNTFDSNVAAARIQQLTETTIDLCFNHMGRAETKYPGIVVCLGGDMITGEIHEELLATNDRTTQQQVNEITDHILAMLLRLANVFGNVYVPCVPGNHGRSTRKPRMKGRVYCVTVDTPILTRDLRWVPAGDLHIGDKLLAFQEEANPGQRQGRNYQDAHVTYARREMAHVNRVTLETGETITATDEHKFLMRGGADEAYHWVSTAEMLARFAERREGRPVVYRIPRMVPVWEHDTSWDAGYLAGAFDADGCLQVDGDQGVTVRLSQYDNETLAQAKLSLTALGFQWSTCAQENVWGKLQHTVNVLGGLPEVLRFLGTVRPPRLLAKWERYDVSQRRLWAQEMVRVVSVEDAGEQEIISLSSSSETYISAGWPSHNTSYEWLVYCAVERHLKDDKRFQFFIPSNGDAYFRVYGHRFLLTHGDTLGVKGGDGIIGAVGPIMRGSIKVGRSEAEIGRNIDTILMGHWHQMLWLPGCIVNGALKGYDEYARLALRAPYSRPSQALFFVHPEQGITTKWEVYLDRGRTVEDAGEWIGWRTEP